jgi:hypothetical protein
MSREERRQYQRQMKGMERGPALPAGAQARAERNAARRAARRKPAAPPGSFTRRFWIVSVLIAAVVGYLAFSLQWPNMPFAAYLGLGAGGLALAIQVGFRYLQGRTAPR